MTPDSPKPDDRKDKEKEPFVPAVPELEKPKRYEYKILDSEEEARLVDMLTNRNTQPSEKRYSLYLISSDDPGAALARGLEVEVFGEFFNNDETVMRAEYGPYENSSEFLIVVDNRDKESVGVMRLIHNSDSGLKSINDLTNPPWNKPLNEIFEENDIQQSDLEDTLDIATLAVRKKYRGKTAANALYRALYLTTMKENKKEWVSILDDNVLALLEALGIHFKRYQGVGSANYLDSPSSTPVYGNASEIAEHVEMRYPDTHRFVTLGEGTKHEVEFVGLELE